MSGPSLQPPASSLHLGEFDIIAKYFARPSSRGDVLLGIGDDAAVLRSRADRRLVLAMDTIVEGVHFLPGADGTDVGHRALAVNLSDLAAMGAEPSWMSLSLSLPVADEDWLTRFAAGLFSLADRYDVQLIGGDTVRGPLVATIQVGGWVEPERWLTRSGAREGDVICVSGTLGDAAGGLAAMREGRHGASYEYLRERFLRPEPRIALGRALRSVASAAMDVSDGLLTDLRKLCVASGCGARVEVDRLPLSTALRDAFHANDVERFALAGGDDYELLFTVSTEQLARVMEAAANVPIAQIGVITAGSGVACLRAGQPFVPPSAGYDHFAR